MRLSHFLVLIAILFTSLKSEARPDTTYFDEYWQKAGNTNAKYYRVASLLENHLYQVGDYYLKNNKLQMSGYYSNIDSGTRDGVFVFYDEKGNIDNEGSFKNNLKVGEWKYYYPESRDLWYQEHYEDGQLSGDLISYYKSGKIKRRETHKPNDTAVTGYCFEESGEARPFTKMQIMPSAGYSISEFLAHNLHYPDKARRKNKEGRVILSFVVMEDGSIEDIGVLKSVYPDIDDEAKRVVAKMPKWIPGKMDDKVVKVRFTQPILFKLE